MRRIKFRGKRIDGKGWIRNSYTLIQDGDGTWLHDNDVEKIDENTLGRFTGLCDKSGKEIYEGDIVKGFCYEDFYTGIKGNVNAVVRWIDIYAGFMFDVGARCFHDMRDARKIEIIGNIFDNPELLASHQ